jgi:hypothetical protein
MATNAINNTQASVGTSLTDVMPEQILYGDCKAITVQVKNTGATAFNAFVVLRKMHASGDWFTWFSGTDFATATTRLSAGSTSPATLAGGAETWLDIDPGAAYSIKLQASVASGNTSASVLGAARF